jgi:subtilisin family serine protease
MSALEKDGCRVAVIPDAHTWPENVLTSLADLLIARDIVVVIPSDLSEGERAIETVHRLHARGVLTVGRVARDSTVMAERRDTARCFNRHIRRIDTDLFCTVGILADPNHSNIAGVAAGVAALVREKWPDMPGAKVREKMIAAARAVWQATDIETGVWPQDLFVDPITTEYKPGDQMPILRFRVLDAAASVDVDTKIPWFLNMLNCHKAWEITRGRGVTVALSDQGFHLQHPELVGRIEKTRHFGPVTFDRPNQHFHGTEMSRILLRVAPEARIIPLLCSAPTFDDLTPEIARSLQYATHERVDVISASWIARYGKDKAIQSAVEEAVGQGIVVSWFHFPRHVPGVLRSRMTYASWEQGLNLGLADRFLADPPGFHPVEIESGLSGTAPQVAGIAALVRSVNSRLTPAQIEELIFKNSTPIGNAIVIPDAYQIVLAARKTGNSPE